MIQVIKPQFKSQHNIWLTAQKQIIKGMGFFGSESKYENSVFYDGNISISEHLQSSDARIIQAFYNPDIKSGMTEQELDEVLTKVLANKVNKRQ